MKTKTAALILACLCQNLIADSSTDKEAEIHRMQEKESNSAKDTADRLADREAFEKRYGYLKKDNASLYDQALEKQLLAAKAWRTAAAGLEKVTSYDQVTAARIPAQDAEAAANVACMELRFAASEKEWRKSADKYKSRDVEALAMQLIQNQKNQIQTTKQSYASQRLLRQLDVEKAQLDRKMREACENARQGEQAEHDKKNKDSSKNHDKKPPVEKEKKPIIDKDKQPHDPKPPGKVLVD